MMYPTMRDFLRSLFLCVAFLLPTIVGAQSTETPDRPNQYWPSDEGYKTDLSNVKTLTNRRALVGFGCLVNNTHSGVTALEGFSNVTALTDEDLTNYASIPAAANATLGFNDYVGVRDVRHTYGKGTVAGFVIADNSGTSVLTLDVLDSYAIRFVKNGTGTVVRPTEGENSTLLNLGLVNIAGSGKADRTILATAPMDFDEVELVQYGVDATVATSLNIKYAFVGENQRYYISNVTAPTINEYQAKHNRPNVTVVGKDALGVIHKSLTNDLEDAHVHVSVVVGGGASRFIATHDNGSEEEVFKAGTRVGIKLTPPSGINVGDLFITFKNQEGDDVGSNINLSGSLLGINLGVESKIVTVELPVDCSEIRVQSAAVAIGGWSVFYAFIEEAPDLGEHHCEIAPSADLALCDCDNVYQLSAKMEGVEWSIVSYPDGANPTISNIGLLEGLTASGKYVVRATAPASQCSQTPRCHEDITINYGLTSSFSYAENGEHIWANGLDQRDDVKSEAAPYSLSTTSGLHLISLGQKLKYPQALITPDLSDVAHTVQGLNLVDVTEFVAVKRSKAITVDTEHGRKVGFVVAMKADVLSADLLNYFTIGVKKEEGGTTDFCEWNGVKRHVISSAHLLNASAVGTDGMQRMRLEITVPKDISFDEVVLCRDGVLDLSLSRFDIYYAYDADPNTTFGYDSPVVDGEIMSVNNTGASLAQGNKSFTVLNVGSGVVNIANFIDDSPDSYATLPTGVTLGQGTKLDINLGRTVNTGQRFVLEMGNKELALGVKLVDVLKMTLYCKGVKVQDVDSWSVLGANLVGAENEKSYMGFTAVAPFDEVVIEHVDVLKALESPKLNAMYIVSDADRDGIADSVDPDPCLMDLVFDEDKSLKKTHDYNNCKMYFHRTFTPDGWSGLVLPVSLTQAKFTEAFGAGAKLAEAEVLQQGSNDGETANVIYFKSTTEKDGYYLQAGKPYIIYMPEANIANEDALYVTNDEGEVSGPCYIVSSGLTYKYEANPQTQELTAGVNKDTGIGYSSVNVYGTYNCKEEKLLLPGDYVFNKGNLYHLTKEGHTQKAYRIWLRMAGGSGSGNAKLQMSVDDAITAIRTIDADASRGEAVYNLAGQRQGGTLAPGIYIVGKKKMVVR